MQSLVLRSGSGFVGVHQNLSALHYSNLVEVISFGPWWKGLIRLGIGQSDVEKIVWNVTFSWRLLAFVCVVTEFEVGAKNAQQWGFRSPAAGRRRWGRWNWVWLERRYSDEHHGFDRAN